MRRYEGKNEAKNYQNRINDLGVAMGKHKADSLKYLYELEKDPSNKELQDKIDNSVNKIYEGRDECLRLLDEADAKGFSVTSKEVIDSRLQGKQYFDYVRNDPKLSSVWSLEVVWSDYGPTYYATTKGDKVKVRKSKKSSK